MAFQFQSVAVVAPLLGRDLGLGFADIGVLIGLYLVPGIVLALPGGAIGQRFGDKQVVLAGLGLMIVGGLVMALMPSWSAQVVGRLLSGVGGVLLNVLMSKMVTDWFSGREIATAMAIFVNSWPAGIAIALVALPPIAASYGIETVFLAAVALVAFGAILLALTYSAPASTKVQSRGARPTMTTGAAVILSGLIWGLYNLGFAMIFSFGPSLLTERGLQLTAAGSITSTVLWLTLASVPLGGVLADRTKRPYTILVAGCLAAALLLLLATRVEPLPIFIATGIIVGLPAGAIMSLPARVLAAETRAVGMGLYYTIFYLAVGIGPTIAGWVAAKAGTIGATFAFGAAALATCPLLLWAFHHLAAAAMRDMEERSAPSGLP